MTKLELGFYGRMPFLTPTKLKLGMCFNTLLSVLFQQYLEMFMVNCSSIYSFGVLLGIST